MQNIRTNNKNYRHLPIVIMGGGLASLIFAFEFKRLCPHVEIFLVEKESEIGGLARSVVKNNSIFDLGPHIIRTDNKDLESYIFSIMEWKRVKTNPAIYYKGKLLDSVTPCISKKNINALDEETKIKALSEYRNTQKFDRETGKNFEERLVKQIGYTLYNEFFGKYSRKWWGIDTKKLHRELAPRSVKIADKAFYAHRTSSFKRQKNEYYPLYGSFGELAKELEKRITDLGVHVIKASAVEKLRFDKNQIKSAIISTGGKKFEIKGTLFISTIPLNLLCNFLNIRCDLHYRGDIFVLLRLKKKNLFAKSWIYFPDKNVVFSRVTDMNYYLSNSFPSTNIFVEISAFEGDEVWRDDHLIDKVIKHFSILNLATEKEIQLVEIVKHPHAYPLYEVDYKAMKEEVLRKLSVFKNLVVLGRTGRFEYINSDGVIWQGINKAREIYGKSKHIKVEKA